MKLELHAKPEEVMRAVETFEAFARSHNIGEPELLGLSLALEEFGSNIVNHALQRNPQQKFHVGFERSPDAVVIELRDGGPAFDPTMVATRKVQAADDDVPGGWGIQLARGHTDAISY